MKVELKDLELSKNFHKFNDNLKEHTQILLNKHKDCHSDTIEAMLILKTSKQGIKSKYSNVSFCLRRNVLLYDLKESFPRLDEKKLNFLLLKNGYVSEQFIIKSLLIIYSLLLILFYFIFKSVFNYVLSFPIEDMFLIFLGNIFFILALTVFTGSLIGIKYDIN